MTILTTSKECGVNYVQNITPVGPNVGDTWFNPLDGKTQKFVGGISNSWGLMWVNKGYGPGANYGYNMGGYASVYLSTVERITFPFDSGTASIVGNLSASKRYVAGCDGTDFVTLFS